MSEQVPLRPVIEVRETFTPSEPLRRELTKFMVHPYESQHAALLFKSWRRRLMDVEEYARSERDRGGPLYSAHQLFDSLPRAPIRVTGLAIADAPSDDPTAPSRLVLRTPMTDTFMSVERVLDKIPTIERAQTPLMSRTWLYEDIAKRSLMQAGPSRKLLMKGFSSRLADPKLAPNYTILPVSLSIKHTFWGDPDTVEVIPDTGAEASETQSA